MVFLFQDIILNHICQVPLPCHVTYSGFQGSGRGQLWEPLFCPPQLAHAPSRHHQTTLLCGGAHPNTASSMSSGLLSPLKLPLFISTLSTLDSACVKQCIFLPSSLPLLMLGFCLNLYVAPSPPKNASDQLALLYTTK